MAWVGVDPLHHVVTRDEAMDFIPWLSVRWQTSPPDSGHYFWWDDKGLALKSAAIDARSSVHVDFLHGAGARRVKAVTGEALTRAMGCQKGLRPSIIDMTAGLGGDLSVLANVGCEIFAMEKHPVVAALLRDALRRAAHAETSWCERVQFRHADSVERVSGVSHGVVYLDPMFPSREKSAAVKKDLLWLQWLNDYPSSEEEHALLQWAREQSPHRIVVKRPAKAPQLAGQAPGFSQKGKAVRFDVYPLG